MRLPALLSGHWRELILAATLSLVAATTPAAAAAAQYVRIVNVAPGDVLWLHSGPGPKFERVGSVPHDGRHIRIYKCRHAVTRRWCQVRYHGTRGWAARHFLTKDATRIVRHRVGASGQ
jgi:uncharacterized protein YraI